MPSPWLGASEAFRNPQIAVRHACGVCIRVHDMYLTALCQLTNIALVWWSQTTHLLYVTMPFFHCSFSHMDFSCWHAEVKVYYAPSGISQWIESNHFEVCLKLTLHEQSYNSVFLEIFVVHKLESRTLHNIMGTVFAKASGFVRMLANFPAW